jgi:hypothetical protein
MDLRVSFVGLKVLCVSTWYRKSGMNFLVCFSRNFVLFICGSFLSGWRGTVGISFYLYMRKIDDIVDGDVSPPPGYTIDQYVEHKKRVICRTLAGVGGVVDEEEILLLHLLKEADRRKMPVRPWLYDIFNVFLFDYAKRVHRQPVSRETLVQLASKQDAAIFSILISLGLGGGPEDNPLFEAIAGKVRKLDGFATRQDSLVDLFEDLGQGSVNIPYQVLLEGGVDVKNLLQCRTREELFLLKGLEEWYVGEKRWIEECWGEAEKFLPELLALFESWFIRYAITLLFVQWRKRFERSMR